MTRAEPDDGWTTRQDLDRRLDRCRSLILASLDGLTDDEARAVVVPGSPSMLGVVRHTVYVEAVWFHEAVTGRSHTELDTPAATATSWKARRSDTIVSISQHCREVHDAARANLAPLDLDAVVEGRGRRTILSLCTHVLEELAWNTGQLDVLRAAVLAARA